MASDYERVYYIYIKFYTCFFEDLSVQYWSENPVPLKDEENLPKGTRLYKIPQHMINIKESVHKELIKSDLERRMRNLGMHILDRYDCGII